MQLSNDQLANIAHDYYISKLNIAEISAKYNLSRYLIDKALSDAEKTGIVQINIKEGAKQNPGLEKKFPPAVWPQGSLYLKEAGD